METAFLENVVAAVAGELDVPAVDRPDLLGAELAVDEDGVGGEAEGPQGVEARDGHRRASAHDDLQKNIFRYIIKKFRNVKRVFLLRQFEENLPCV